MSVRVERRYDKRIHVIAIDRPEIRNAVDRATADALYKAFKAFEDDSTACVAILTGTGGHFCSGADLRGVATRNLHQMNRLDQDMDAPAPMGLSRMKLSKPVIAAISGAAVAGGLELACWCDLRVSHKDALLGVFCRRIGVPLIDGGTVRLPKLIGVSRALDMILTGRGISGQEAFDWGLINRVVDSKDDVLPEALRLAELLCEFPQTCLRNDRASVYQSLYDGVDQNELLRTEMNLGWKTIQDVEMFRKATEFAQGKGRHGAHIESRL